jgi:hypothetical protein
LLNQSRPSRDVGVNQVGQNFADKQVGIRTPPRRSVACQFVSFFPLPLSCILAKSWRLLPAVQHSSIRTALLIRPTIPGIYLQLLKLHSLGQSTFETFRSAASCQAEPEREIDIASLNSRRIYCTYMRWETQILGRAQGSEALI